MRTIRTSYLLIAASILGLVLLIGVGLPAGAQEGPGFLAANGRVSYRLYCASCHGTDGEGEGPVAKFLTVAPPDLTRIEQRYGEWPEETLYMQIDGREEVGAHGRRDMPVWGEVLQSPLADDLKAGSESEERADRKIRELVLYLKTIQTTD